MHSNSQTNAVSGLLGAADKGISRSSKSAGAAADNSSSSLKNKGFSSVMDDQRQMREAPPAKDSSASREAAPAPAKQAPDKQEKVSAKGKDNADDGKALPGGGQDLPPADQSAGKSQDAASASLRWWSAADPQAGGKSTQALGEAANNPSKNSRDVVLQADATSEVTDKTDKGTDKHNKKADPKTDTDTAADVAAADTTFTPVTAAASAPGAAVKQSGHDGKPSAEVTGKGQGGAIAGLTTSARHSADTLSGADTGTATNNNGGGATSDGGSGTGAGNGAAPTPANQFGATMAALAQKRDASGRTSGATGAVRQAAVTDAPGALNSASSAQATAASPLQHHSTVAGQNTPVAQTSVPTTVGKPGWSEGVAQQVMWMSSQHISKAEIALDPPDLGPLHVRISTHGDHTAVSFSSAHGVVRDALDQGMPKLRDMMQSQGINLVDVDVSGQNPQQQAHSGNGAGQGNPSAPQGLPDSGLLTEETAADTGAMQTMSVSRVRATSLVDHYV